IKPLEWDQALDLVEITFHWNDVDLSLFVHDVPAEHQYDVVLNPRRLQKLCDRPFNYVAQRRHFSLRSWWRLCKVGVFRRCFVNSLFCTEFLFGLRPRLGLPAFVP